MTFMNKTSIDQTGNEQVYEARTLTLDSLVAGIPVPSDKYVHTIHADAMLTDAFAWMTRKRLLDRNRAESGTDITAVSGRTALGTTASVELALQAGHSAAKEWASRPAKVRREFVLQVNAALQTAGDQFVELLVAEGHPRRLAEWELDGALKGSSAATYDFCDSLVGKSHEVAGSTVGLRRRPVGLVGMVPSQNAAASTSLLGIPALAAGNALIVKPPRSSPPCHGLGLAGGHQPRVGISWCAGRNLVCDLRAPAGDDRPVAVLRRSRLPLLCGQLRPGTAPRAAVHGKRRKASPGAVW